MFIPRSSRGSPRNVTGTPTRHWTCSLNGGRELALRGALVCRRLHRRCGDALWRRGDDAAARRCFEQALDVARGQGAKLWELQAATSYARMLRDQGKPAEAAALLAPVYAWFNEGFDTMPLRQARALLDELDRSVDEAPRTEARVAAFPRSARVCQAARRELPPRLPRRQFRRLP